MVSEAAASEPDDFKSPWSPGPATDPGREQVWTRSRWYGHGMLSELPRSKRCREGASAGRRDQGMPRLPRTGGVPTPCPVRCSTASACRRSSSSCLSPTCCADGNSAWEFRLWVRSSGWWSQPDGTWPTCAHLRRGWGDILPSRPPNPGAVVGSESVELRYTSANCFELLPYPQTGRIHLALAAAGGSQYAIPRGAEGLEHGEGMTRTGQRFRAPEERGPRTAALRKLHAAMDRTVPDAGCGPDLATDGRFRLNHEVDAKTSERGRKLRRRRGPGANCDEVRARLRVPNAGRTAEERMARRQATGADR